MSVQTLNDPPSLHIDGPVATLCLNRPQLANRLSVADLQRLHQHIECLRAKPELRLVLLRGAGAHFCAGFQIDAVDEVDAPALFEQLTDAWESLPMQTLAVIQGDVWGGAVDWALACDFRLGGPSGRLGIPAARLGLHFYSGGMQRLVSRLGLSAAKRLLLAAEVWQDDQRLHGGFLDAQSGDLEALVGIWQQRLLDLAPLAQQGMKRHLNALDRRARDPDVAAQFTQDSARCAASQDLAEGLLAWKQKRPPRFRGV